MIVADVMARAYGGKPIRRQVFEVSESLVYLVNPAYLAEVERGESDAVGFPREDVFEFDQQLLEDINKGVRDWTAATPARLPLKPASRG